MTTATQQRGMRFGYARVSTLDQDEGLQLDALKAAGDRVFVDKASGALESRPALDELLGQLRAGDTVVVWRLDRLGRSPRHLIDVMSDLDRREVALASLRESLDTSTPGGRLVFHVFGAPGSVTKWGKNSSGRDLPDSPVSTGRAFRSKA